MSENKKKTEQEEIVAEAVEDTEKQISVEEKLTAEIEALKKELEVTKNAYYKAYADTENTKRRLQQDFERSNKYKLQGFGLDVLPVLDNLERALAIQSENEEVKNFAKGFEMIHKQLIEILEKEGIQEIEALNKPFDPNYHHAIMQEPKEGVESSMVIEVFQKGYMLKDRILRPSLVKVSE